MTMTALDTIRSAWLKEVNALFADDSALRRIRDGKSTREQYAAMLIQLHLQVREHPPALAALTLGLRGEARDLVRGILGHARSETGHDQLALRDLETLGVDSSSVTSMRPLPATAGLLGFMFWTLQERPALGFLGYLFNLEFLPTHFGAELEAGLLRAGIPAAAMTFLGEHREADVGHNQLMGLYVDKLVRGDAELEEVVYAVRVTARLYDRMLTEAMAMTVRAEPADCAP
jgi:pyrroloquinoline quinone (PQQ) biosynthesis protein C